MQIDKIQTGIVEIYDVLGKRLYQKSVNSINSNNKITWQPDESISSGIFLIKLSDKDLSLCKRVVYIK
jgi:hypothetical protein